MRFSILNKTKKKKFLKKIDYLDLDKSKLMFISTGKEKVRAFSGILSNDELIDLARLIPIESIGLYLGKDLGNEARLSIDALHLFENQINKNIITLNQEQEDKWFKGKDIELTKEQQELTKEQNIQGFVVIKSQSQDIIGPGKLSVDNIRLFNYLPKERQIKTN